MDESKDLPSWLVWAREIQSLSQTGLHYSLTDFDTQRYQRLFEIAAEMVASQTALETTELLAVFNVQPGYATPKVDVRGAVVRDGQILMVQERSDGLWCLPGGWADVGDYPAEMVVREVWEESGYEVKAQKVVGVFDANRTNDAPMEFFHAYKILFLCDLLGGEARISNETMAVEFFDFDDIPPLSSFRTNHRHLAEIRAHLVEPSRATVFD